MDPPLWDLGGSEAYLIHNCVMVSENSYFFFCNGLKRSLVILEGQILTGQREGSGGEQSSGKTVA